MLVTFVRVWIKQNIFDSSKSKSLKAVSEKRDMVGIFTVEMSELKDFEESTQ